MMQQQQYSFSRLLFLLQCMILTSHTIQAHFLWAEHVIESNVVSVTFSEPVAMAGDGMSFVSDRLDDMILIQPGDNSGEDDSTIISLPLVDRGDHMEAILPSDDTTNNNKPTFITGFLDYGPFGEDGTMSGQSKKKDLQYTFSVQLSSTNPSDDWKDFYHPMDIVATKHFTIVFRNYGPVYELRAGGLKDGADTVITACLYSGTAEKIACVTDSQAKLGHILFDPLTVPLLTPCETYFVLANVTTDDAMKYSSTSILWNGPCTAAAAADGDHDRRSFVVVGLGAFLMGLLVSSLVGQQRSQRNKVAYTSPASAATDSSSCLEMVDEKYSDDVTTATTTEVY